ncbi:hypothetical protein E2C01_062074 [Portunus trituberculatus]|uniref:Uncharacterized protein n=1 Tax=Portunus trituberculatus TaxID=210409 RepID=A0A5B7HG34_PORTR|nr:hypothetical protein [Portunus trituberculatus]
MRSGWREATVAVYWEPLMCEAEGVRGGHWWGHREGEEGEEEEEEEEEETDKQAGH